MKFNKGGMGIRILYKSEKWLWVVCGKEKWFWEDGGRKLIKVRSKAHIDRVEKRKREKRKNKKKGERKQWDKIPHSTDQG